MLSPSRTGSAAPAPQVELFQVLVCPSGLGGRCFNRPWAASTPPEPCTSRAALENVFILWDTPVLVPVRWEAGARLPAPWCVHR